MNGVRVRADIVADINGEIHIIEVKNGPHASYTHNQRIVYPQMENNVPIIPKGNNAKGVTKFDIGVPTTDYKFSTYRYNTK